MIDLPVMQCDDGCGKCCGPVLCSQQEYAAVASYVREHGITARRQGPDVCPFYQEGRCAVYEARPFPCRLFGHIPAMTCCNGHNVNLSRSQEKRVMAKYGSERGSAENTRLLHEFAYGPAAFGLVVRHMEIQEPTGRKV